MIDGDGSTLSAFMDSEQFERVQNRPSDLGHKICERRADLLWTVAVAAELSWGRAPFCLQAGVEIHKQTGNAKGRERVLRPSNRASGMIGGQVLNARAFEIGDPAPDTRERSGNSTAG